MDCSSQHCAFFVLIDAYIISRYIFLNVILSMTGQWLNYNVSGCLNRLEKMDCLNITPFYHLIQNDRVWDLVWDVAVNKFNFQVPMLQTKNWKEILTFFPLHPPGGKPLYKRFKGLHDYNKSATLNNCTLLFILKQKQNWIWNRHSNVYNVTLIKPV